MKKENLTDLQLYSAGATVRHISPFENLISYVNEIEISQTFRDEWVIPFYFELNNKSDEWVKKMIQIKSKINDDVILQNLGDFDWRTRSTGAYFASITEAKKFTDVIGVHLLKSEVCYAGNQYAITLASFNTLESAEYLNKYLDYYLQHSELYFDQVGVMSALKFFDELNGTNFCSKHAGRWKQFCQSRITKIEKSLQKFQNQKNELAINSFETQLKFWHEDISSKQVVDAINIINIIKNG